jgi:hypothetical protein
MCGARYRKCSLTSSAIRLIAISLKNKRANSEQVESPRRQIRQRKPHASFVLFARSLISSDDPLVFSIALDFSLKFPGFSGSRNSDRSLPCDNATVIEMLRCLCCCSSARPAGLIVGINFNWVRGAHLYHAQKRAI